MRKKPPLFFEIDYSFILNYFYQGHTSPDQPKEHMPNLAKFTGNWPCLAKPSHKYDLKSSPSLVNKLQI